MSLELLNDPAVAGGLKPTFCAVTASTVAAADLLSVTAGVPGSGGNVAVQIKSIDAATETSDQTWAMGLEGGAVARLATWAYDNTGKFITDRLTVNRLSRATGPGIPVEQQIGGLYVGQQQVNRSPVAALNVGHATVWYEKAGDTGPQSSLILHPTTVTDFTSAALLSANLPPDFTPIAAAKIKCVILPPFGQIKIGASAFIENTTCFPAKIAWSTFGAVSLDVNDTTTRYSLDSNF